MKMLKILNNKISVSVWDFAGQPQYITTHQAIYLISLLILKLFLGAANTIYFLVVDAQHSIQQIHKSLLFWTKYITSFSRREKISQEYSIIAIGNQIDKVDPSKVIVLENFFKSLPPQVISNWCLISGSLTDIGCVTISY